MDTKRFLTIALITVSSGSALARAGQVDCPRPVLWERYPRIKQQVSEGLAKLPDNLAALEPEAFVARYPRLAEMAKSKDWAQRMRALRAIAALEDPAGIPLLVAAIMDAREKDEASLNGALNTLTMWIATRAPRDKFKPLAPLFLDILVNAHDWPSVRCRCLQGLGNLADRDWLPIVKDLLVSRHPAVTNKSTWVIQQMSSRPGPGDDTRANPALPPPCPLDLILRESETRYKPSEHELATIVERIKRLTQSPPTDRDDDQVFYSNNIGWFDNWIPMSPSLKKEPPNGKYMRTWRYRNGRICSVTLTEAGKPPWVEERVWYNSLGGPILSVDYIPAGKQNQMHWGDYDRNGLLRRVIRLNADYSLSAVRVHDIGSNNCRTIIREFDSQGRLRSITRYAEGKVYYTDVMRDAPEKVVNSGSRTDCMNLLKSTGLAPFYPMPAGQGTVPLESAARPRTATPPTTQPKAIAALADVLAGAPASRVTAAAALGELGAEHKSAVRPLLRALNDPDPSVRVAAAQALDHIRWQFHQIRPNLNGDELWPSNSEFVPPLVGLLADKNGEVRHAAIFCLIRVGPPARAAMQPLVNLYWFGTAQDRPDALSALGSIDPDDRASVAIFLDAAKSSDVSMRVFAAAAMSHVKVDPAGRGIVRALAGALADEAWNVRAQAAYGLELLGPAAKAAVPALKVAIDDPDETVRRHAAHALEVIERNHPKMPQPSSPRRGRRHDRTGRWRGPRAHR